MTGGARGPLVEIEALSVEFGAPASPLIAVDRVDLTIDAGEIVGCVGESGSGKTVTALAMMGLIDPPGLVRATRMQFDGHDLLALSDADRRALTGKDVAMIFQDPLASLNPCFTVAFQLMEALRLHGSAAEKSNRRLRRQRAFELLLQVEIPAAASRLDAYPHQLSGGMAQRVMIAMAIACQPRLLIADEPTTALDVTVQAQVLDLLVRLQRERAMALLLITHDLAVVAETAQRVIVMYAGEQVEMGPVPELFDAPRHPYTQALLEALPERNQGRRRLQAIPGTVPGLGDRPAGCLFSPRCAYAIERCRRERPTLELLPRGEPAAGSRSTARAVRCHFPLDNAGHPTRGWQAEEADASTTAKAAHAG